MGSYLNESYREAVESAKKLNEVIEAANEIAETSERISEVPSFDFETLDSLDPADDSGAIRSLLDSLKDAKYEHYSALSRQLRNYQSTPNGVGPFPLDAIERVLASHTNYSPSWVPSDEATTTNNLSDDLDHFVEELQHSLDGLYEASMEASR